MRYLIKGIADKLRRAYKMDETMTATLLLDLSRIEPQSSGITPEKVAKIREKINILMDDTARHRKVILAIARAQRG